MRRILALLVALSCVGCSSRPTRCVVNVEARYTPICTTVSVRADYEVK